MMIRQKNRQNVEAMKVSALGSAVDVDETEADGKSVNEENLE